MPAGTIPPAKNVIEKLMKKKKLFESESTDLKAIIQNWVLVHSFLGENDT